METNAENQNTGTFNRLPQDFGKRSRSAIFLEPKRGFWLTYVLLLLSAGSLFLWSFNSYLNQSVFLQGEVFSMDPVVKVVAGENFRIEKVKITLGQRVQKGSLIASYRNSAGTSKNLTATVPGIITHMAALRIGESYSKGTEIAHLRPDPTQLSLKLNIPRSEIGKVRPGQMAVLEFQSLSSGSVTIQEGISLEPFQEAGSYMVPLTLSLKGAEDLKAKGVVLAEGLPVRAEVILGRKRLIRHILGI